MTVPPRDATLASIRKITTTSERGRWIATGRNWGRLYGVPTTEQLRITERFKRVDAQTLSYQVTVEDPEIYTSPWTLAYPFTLDNDYRIYEYACHEGNQAIELILLSARVQEAGGGG